MIRSKVIYLLLLITLNPTFPSASSKESFCPKLHWYDEFDGSELNATNWNIAIGDGCIVGICGWGNNESETYTSDNVLVENGNLILEARKSVNAQGEIEYTSGRINSDHLVDIDIYGRFEARIRLPIGGPGIWPAFWMLPSEWIFGGWPASGEIDIMENIGREPYTIHGTIHYGDQAHYYQGKSVDMEEMPFSVDYHTFAVDREFNSIRFILDDVVYFSISADDIGDNNWPFNEKFYFLFNLAVGGYWPGYPDDSTFFPQQMLVDYVRVYDRPLPSLDGPKSVEYVAPSVTYNIANSYAGSMFIWTVPDDATIVSGQGTPSVVVDFGAESGSVSCQVSNSTCEIMDNTFEMNVTVRGKLIKSFCFFCFEGQSQATVGFRSGSLVLNPNYQSCGLVTSGAVWSYTRDRMATYDVMSFHTSAVEDAADYVTCQKVVYIDVFTSAPIGTEIMLQFEDSEIATKSNFPAGRHSRYLATTAAQSKWERLVFSYLDSPDVMVSGGSVDRLALLFEPNKPSGDEFLFDNFDSYATFAPEIPTAPAKAPVEMPFDIIQSEDSPSVSSICHMCPKLKWSDEFDGTVLDHTKWNIMLGNGCSYEICGWGNQELEIYGAENVILKDDGILRIEARKVIDANGHVTYTSSRINTSGKADFDPYGRFEARIRIPFGKGIWPAFWMLPSDSPLGWWPSGGEIDIMENMGKDNSIHIDAHYAILHMHKHMGKSIHSTEKYAYDFHVFAVEREWNLLRWLIDDNVVFTLRENDVGSTWPFNERFHFLLNVAVGGSPGNPDSSTHFPQHMEVDYVRVYDRPMPSLKGLHSVRAKQSGVSYQIINAYPDCSFSWEVFDDALISSGQKTNQIQVDFGKSHNTLIICELSCSCLHNGNKTFSVLVEQHIFTLADIMILAAVSVLIIVAFYLIYRKCVCRREDENLNWTPVDTSDGGDSSNEIL